MGPNLFFEKPEIIYLQPQEMAWHHHGSDKPTSTRAILHHTDPNAPNISGGECTTTQQKGPPITAKQQF